jgi:hypothetical protein
MFSIQLDESTDVHLAQFLVYIRYAHNDNIKQFLFCRPMETKLLQEIYLKLCLTLFMLMVCSRKSYVQSVWMEPVPCWAADQVFKISMKTVAPKATGTHCVIHRLVLAAKFYNQV